MKETWVKSAIGAVLATLCGLLLWGTPVGDAWENASYDSLFRFGSPPDTNQIVLIVMDNASYDTLQQDRGRLWDRALHTQLLNKLNADGTRLVVFDVLFLKTNNPTTDMKLAEAMRQNGKVMLMADVSDGTHPHLDSASIVPPLELFLNAAAGCGVGHVDAETGGIVRHHWPFYAPGEGDIHSLGWSAAQVWGANLNANVRRQWLRYYGENGPGERLPYYQALTQPPGFFHNKIIFIGGWPEKPDDPGSIKDDKFRTPYTAETGRAVGGVVIMATTFLNLVNGDWLRRLPTWIEVMLVVLTGILIGGGLCQLKPLLCTLVGAGVFLVVMLAFVSWSYFSNYWFPWLVIVGGQVPCALAVSFVSWLAAKPGRELSRYPGYEPLGKSFDAGAFGKVFLVRDQAGHLRALKEVNLKKLNGDREAYQREFHGLETYMPISDRHFALLQVKSVRRFDDQGYFFYVMELSDPLDPGWDRRSPFEPFSLNNYCARAGGRLAVGECLRIGTALAEALDILHQANLVHRDVKPANVVFVNGRPKLADIGLVREVPRSDENSTIVFTQGFEDPLGLGTKLADVYALAITLYVVSTGKPARSFSGLPTTLVEMPEFMRLNEIICKACQPAADQRYPSAGAMLAALRHAQSELEEGDTKKM